MTEAMIILRFPEWDPDPFWRRLQVTNEHGVPVITIHEPNDLATPIRLVFADTLPDLSNEGFFDLIRNQEEAALRVMGAERRKRYARDAIS